MTKGFPELGSDRDYNLKHEIGERDPENYKGKGGLTEFLGGVEL